MRILMNEFKKIWNPILIGIAIVVASMYYFIFMSASGVDFKRSHPVKERMDYAVQFTEQFGGTMSEQDMEQVAQLEEELTVELDQEIQKIPELAEAGIESYDDYEKHQQEYSDAEDEANEKDLALEELMGVPFVEKDELIDTLFKPFCDKEFDYIAIKVQTLDTFLSNYEGRQGRFDEEYMDLAQVPNTKLALQQLEQTYADIEKTGLMPLEIKESYWNYSIFGFVGIFLILCIVLTPAMVQDRIRKVDVLQYSSRTGRKVCFAQYGAMLGSGLLITTIMIGIFALFFLQTGAHALWNNPMSSFIGSDYGDPFYSFTFGQYVMATIGLFYLLVIGVVSILFALSKSSRNFISLILKIVPLFVVLCFLCVAVFLYAFHKHNPIFTVITMPSIELLVAIMIMVIGLVASLVYYCFERRADMLG